MNLASLIFSPNSHLFRLVLISAMREDKEKVQSVCGFSSVVFRHYCREWEAADC